MASPWKFLARLVSPRRLQKQDDGATDVIPDVAARLGHTEANPIEESAERIDQPTPDTPTPVAQTAAFSTNPEPMTQAGGYGQGAAAKDGDGNENDTQLALRDIGATPAYAIPLVTPSAEAAPGKSRGRVRKIAPIAVISQTATVVPTISDEISLDQEIKTLRTQLTQKLRLQNAQLKKMLERFER